MPHQHNAGIACFAFFLADCTSQTADPSIGAHVYMPACRERRRLCP